MVEEAEAPATREDSPRAIYVPYWRRAFASKAFVVGLVMFSALALLAALAPVIAPFDPAVQDLSSGLLPPSPEHILGTDQLGRDIFTRMLYAARTDLRIAIFASIIPFIVGVSLGIVAGFCGGWFDAIISRITDTVIAFPFYVIVIALVFAVGVGERGIYVAFALVGWIGYYRVMRVATRALRSSGWVEAARGAGMPVPRILARQLLPNVLPQALVLLMTEILLIMVAVVTLSYLGLGVQPPTPDWGTMISDGQSFITTKWWISAIPGFAVVYVGISLSLIADGLGDAWRVQ
ncbi:ABC transporter permease [Actinomycetaceae bacterium WB03_NA08]|uniref:ABC transporter permease n=2 Tax=Scrofimicrobium canadense TaxID=2652290 RepID=A0A6N7W932_9ACTO|nr:ABC transporter permease [Scrofimicrobium canadense]